MVQLHFTNNITQGSCSQVFNGRNRPFYTVSKQFCVCNLVEHNVIYLHGNIIFCNNRLGFKVYHLFL